MAQPVTLSSASLPLQLKIYAADLPLSSLAVGVDNIHHDVFLSPSWTDQTRLYILERVRQAAQLNFTIERDPRRAKPRPPDSGAWKRLLRDLLHHSLTRAKYEKKIERDLLLRVALAKFLTQEIGSQFSHMMLEAKEWMRARGAQYEHSESGHLFKARLAELQSGRRAIFRQVGLHMFQALAELEESQISRARQALFGQEQRSAYELLMNRLAFVENGRDDMVFLEHYVLLGNYQQDPDRFEVFQALLLGFLHELLSQGAPVLPSAARSDCHFLQQQAQAARAELAGLESQRHSLLQRLRTKSPVLSWLGAAGNGSPGALRDLEARMQAAQSKISALQPLIEQAGQRAEFASEERRQELAGYLNEPENARLLFDPAAAPDGAAAEARLDHWMACLEDNGLLPHVLASYEVRNIFHDYCPPLHLQHLRRALVSRDAFERAAAILRQFPARHFSLEPIEALARKLRRYPRGEARSLALRFAADFMRLRRDLHNYERLAAAMERISLVSSEKTREISRLNNSLYEFLLPSESAPEGDAVVSHTIIKADVRGSTRITRELLDRGLNPAALFSLNLFEPVKRILARYSASKVFIEGDAIILAINETESNRATQRPVSKACALARQLLLIAAAYNERPESADLPRLELGVGIAFQNSAPAYWVDSDSRIMISKALNLSDRLSSCSKAARRLLGETPSIFRVLVFQPAVSAEDEEEASEFLMRFNLNGIELNQEGFAKLSEEISLRQLDGICEMPWGREPVSFFLGEAPIGDGLEPVLVRRGLVRTLLPDGQIGPAGQRPYYEVCTHPKTFEIVHALMLARPG